MTLLKKLAANTRGATAIEYGIIAAVISAVAIGGFTVIGNQVGTKVNTVKDEVSK